MLGCVDNKTVLAMFKLWLKIDDILPVRISVL